MKLIPLLLMLSFLAGCSSLPYVEQLFASSDDTLEMSDGETRNQNNGVLDVDASSITGSTPNTLAQSTGPIDAFGSIVKPPIMNNSNGSYKSMPLTKHVGDYVRNMAQNLVSNMEYVSERGEYLDIPYDDLMEVFNEHYPDVIAGGTEAPLNSADWEADVDAETEQ